MAVLSSPVGSLVCVEETDGDTFTSGVWEGGRGLPDWAREPKQNSAAFGMMCLSL